MNDELKVTKNLMTAEVSLELAAVPYEFVYIDRYETNMEFNVTGNSISVDVLGTIRKSLCIDYEHFD